jgi:hypothetical protein
MQVRHVTYLLISYLKHNTNIAYYNSACCLPVVKRFAEPEENPDRGFFREVLMKTFGAKKQDVTGGWRKLNFEGLRNAYYSLSTI